MEATHADGFQLDGCRLRLEYSASQRPGGSHGGGGGGGGFGNASAVMDWVCDRCSTTNFARWTVCGRVLRRDIQASSEYTKRPPLTLSMFAHCISVSQQSCLAGDNRLLDQSRRADFVTDAYILLCGKDAETALACRRLECHNCSTPRPSNPRRVAAEMEAPSHILKLSNLDPMVTCVAALVAVALLGSAQPMRILLKSSALLLGPAALTL